jgi:hypothetical protein
VCTCSGCQCTSASRNLWATVQKEATVQDVYAVYKIHVISQNSRRKESAEGESSKNTLGSAARSLKNVPSLAYVSTLEFAATIQDGVLGLRQAAANFSFFMHQYGRSFLSCIEKMAACIFSFRFKDIKNFLGVDISSAYEMHCI